MPNQESTTDDLTLEALVASDLGLRFAVKPRNATTVLRGHHTSDLDRPSRYLLPDELLLTNGLWLDRRDASNWVSDVHAAGVAALAFGLNDEKPELPDAVLHACRAEGLTLVTVPAQVSFSLITSRIDAGRARTDPARLQLSRLRRLQQRLAGRTAQTELLALLTQETELAAWLLGPGGRVVAGSASPPANELRQAIARAARTGRLPGPSEGPYAAFPIDPRVRHSNLTLIVDNSRSALSDDARLVIETITPGLYIEHAERRAREAMRGTFVRELLELVWTGEISKRVYDARLRALQFEPQREVTVIASANNLPDLADVADGVEARCAYSAFGDVNILLVQDDSDQLVHQIADFMTDGDVNPVLGAGNPGRGPDGLRRSLSEALPACRIAENRSPGTQVVRQIDVGSYSGLLHFVDHRTLTAFQSALLSPLRKWDDEHDGALLPTLRAFVENDGRWRQTARQLHIHHNTLKYRAQRINALTGRDIESLHSRIDFALALAVAPIVAAPESSAPL